MNALPWIRNRLTLGLFMIALCIVSIVIGGTAATNMQMYVIVIVMGTFALILYIVRPIWMISLAFAISPLLDQSGSHPLLGIGFNLASIIRGASIVAMLLTMRNPNDTSPRVNPSLVRGVVILLVPLCLSLPLAVDPVFSLKQTLALGYWVIFSMYIHKKMQTHQDARIVIAGLFLAALTIITTMAPYEIHQIYSMYTDGSFSIYGPYGDGPFNLALSITFWIPLFFILRTRKERLVYGVLAVLLFDILLHTFVRTAILVVLMYLAYAIGKNKQFRKTGILTTGAIVLTGLMFNHIKSGWLLRLHQSNTFNGFSSGRLQLYQVAISRFIEMDPIHKLLGIGFGNTSVIMVANGHAFNTDPQNDFLNTLLSAGILGLVGLIIYLVLFFKDVQLITNRHHRSIATMVFITLLFTAMINGMYSGESTAMIFAIATLELARLYGTDKPDIDNNPIV